MTNTNENEPFKNILKLSYEDNSFNSFVRMGMMKLNTFILLNSPQKCFSQSWTWQKTRTAICSQFRVAK